MAKLDGKETKHKEVIRHLLQFLSQAQFQNSPKKIWASYRAIDSEININEVSKQSQNVIWAYPKVTADSLQFFIPGPGGFERSAFGIEEPVVPSATEVSIHKIQGLLVPGLGFARNGIRLGKGKGYYDKALKDFQGFKVGVCFSTFMVGQLPQNEWDIPMTHLATEAGISSVKEG